MITGKVHEGEARIRFSVRGKSNREREIDAVIDTGYTSFLTLPSKLISTLGLKWQSLDRGTLADGSECLFDVYQATVIWDRRVREILVAESDTAPLVGMALLDGYE